MQLTYQPLTAYAESGVRDQLKVEREDIVFYNVAPDRVRIEITVSNVSLERSKRTQLRLQAAPLGAFLPWKDLTTLWVPPLDASEVITLSTEVSCPRPRPLGRFDHVPPERLLTALGLSDDGDEGTGNGSPSRSLVQKLRQLGRGLQTDAEPEDATQLPPDPMDLFGQGNPHWAGNINVFVGQTAVERHMAQALRIYQGRVNHAMLIVGNNCRNAYLFEVSGDGAAWNPQLSAIAFPPNYTCAMQYTTINYGQWYDVAGILLIVLSIRPPAACARGQMKVHVTRRSTEETAIVEFSLDAAAQGPGCYTL